MVQVELVSKYKVHLNSKHIEDSSLTAKLTSQQLSQNPITQKTA